MMNTITTPAIETTDEADYLYGSGEDAHDHYTLDDLLMIARHTTTEPFAAVAKPCINFIDLVNTLGADGSWIGETPENLYQSMFPQHYLDGIEQLDAVNRYSLLRLLTNFEYEQVTGLEQLEQELGSKAASYTADNVSPADPRVIELARMQHNTGIRLWVIGRAFNRIIDNASMA